MFFNLIKKLIGVGLLGIGVGVLLVLLLPIAGWLFIIGIVIAIAGIVCISS